MLTLAWLAWRELKQGSAVSASPERGAPRGARLMVVAAGDSGYAEGRQFPLAAITTLGRDLGNDIVIADSVDAPEIDRQLTMAGSKPTPLYVRMAKDKAGAGIGTPAYRLQQSDKGPRWLQVIDDAMQERVKAGTRVKS